MNRTRLAAVLLIGFIIAFSLSGVTAVCTAKGVTVSGYISHYYTLFSLSSAPTLLLPLIITLALISLASFLGKQKNVGFLFSAIMAVLYLAFLLSYSAEIRNNSVYNILNEQFIAQGLRIKKRDFNIIMTPNVWCWITLALGFLTAIVSFPSFKNSVIRYHLKAELEPYLYIAPQVVLFIIFGLVPIIYGIYASFTRWDLYNDPVFAGFMNFKTILFDSSNTYYAQLRKGLGNTVIFVLLTTPLCILVPLSIALLTRQVTRGSRLLQAIYYLPTLMSTTTVVLVWRYFFHNTYGMANNFFGFPWNWFSPPYSWAMLVIVTVWWCNGGTMVIYQSALASVPEDQYEAAAIDGAGAVQKFFYITLPNISYPLMYTLVTTIIAQFNVYGQPNLLMGYEYQGANAVLLMYIRDAAFQQGIAGIASAMSMILAALIMVVSFIQIRMMRGDSVQRRGK